MRQYAFSLLIVLCSLHLSWGQVHRSVSLDFKAEEFQLYETDGMLHISSDHYKIIYKNDTSQPALPYVYMNILIGKDETFESATISKPDSLIALDVTMAPNTDATDSSCHKSAQQIVYESKTYPTENFEYAGVQSMDGYRFISVLVCPFTYDASDKRLYMKKHLNLQFSSSKGLQKESMPTSPFIGMNMRNVIKSITVNSADIDRLYPDVTTPRYDTNGEVPFKYIIVTNNAMKPAFETLAEWKTQKGVRTKILTTEEITSNYTGNDLRSKIKAALKDYYDGTFHGLTYVMLAGDAYTIPTLKCKDDPNSNSTFDNNVPTDLYYACLDVMDWDTNGNGDYGEPEEVTDLSPEIFVSRIPVSNISEATAFAQRIISYESHPKWTDMSEKMLMAGCALKKDTLYSVCDTIVCDTMISDVHYKCEKMYNTFIAPYWNGQKVRFYDTGTDFVGGRNYDFIKSNLQDQLSRGYGFVHVTCHGFTSRWDAEDIAQRYTYLDARELQNDGETIILTTACKTNPIDWITEYLGGAFIKNQNSGILAYIGSARSGYSFGNIYQSQPSLDLDGEIFESIFSQQENRLSQAVTLAKSYHLSLCCFYGVIRTLVLGVNQLGDPEMPVFISTPLTFDNISSSFANGAYSLQANQNGCTICIKGRNGNDDYIVEEDANSIVNQNLSGEYTACVTKPGFIPYKEIISDNIAYLQNETFISDVFVKASLTSIGSDVTTNCTQGPVQVKSGKLSINRGNGVNIKNNFEVMCGAEFEIK